MKFEYYVKPAIDRLFRFEPETGLQERWDAGECMWVNVAPHLADDIYSGRVELDEVRAATAKSRYPTAFGAPAPATESADLEVASFIPEETMIRLEVYDAQKLSLEQFASDNSIVEPELTSVRRYWSALQQEISQG